MHILSSLLATLALSSTTAASINRQHVLSQFNPVRHASSSSTPMQVGNGNFAFGVDVTGLQTFQPFNTLSTWGWHNFSLPNVTGQSLVQDFTGLDWYTHGRLVNYDQPNPAEPFISNWLIANPQRINLGRIGFHFISFNITEANLSNKTQTLDLYSGHITSSFTLYGSMVTVETTADPDSDTVSIQIKSDLLNKGKLGVFFDYPYPDINKFDAPFVGIRNLTSLHTTSLQKSGNKAQITHDMDATKYYTSIQWEGEAAISGPVNGTHRYILQPKVNSGDMLDLTVNYSPSPSIQLLDAQSISDSASDWWSDYWESGGFIDLTKTKNANATELQRLILTSQYLVTVNSASSNPPQESGLVNNGWYGKFHMEMVFWHLAHFGRWNKWSLLSRSVPGIYERFLPSSKERAADQGYKGARWGKMSDPTGRSAPGEINSLIIWQQPHVMYFAEMEWRKHSTLKTLQKWDNLIEETADWMASFTWWNASTGVYDLGPPMYPVSENTPPNSTINPVFELSYWRFGLSVASSWKTRQNLPIPKTWTHVLSNLAPLPTALAPVASSNSTAGSTTLTYPVYEGIPNQWIDLVTMTDHPAMIGVYGWLPPTKGVNVSIVENTAKLIGESWDFSGLYGWDFPMLSMNAARLAGAVESAEEKSAWKQKSIDYLLHEYYEFDDIGMPIGGSRVATPYIPACGGLLLATAMLAGGWDGMDETEGRWPDGWTVEIEGFDVGM